MRAIEANHPSSTPLPRQLGKLTDRRRPDDLRQPGQACRAMAPASSTLAESSTSGPSTGTSVVKDLVACRRAVARGLVWLAGCIACCWCCAGFCYCRLMQLSTRAVLVLATFQTVCTATVAANIILSAMATTAEVEKGVYFIACVIGLLCVMLWIFLIAAIR